MLCFRRGEHIRGLDSVAYFIKYFGVGGSERGNQRHKTGAWQPPLQTRLCYRAWNPPRIGSPKRPQQNAVVNTHLAVGGRENKLVWLNSLEPKRRRSKLDYLRPYRFARFSNLTKGRKEQQQTNGVVSSCNLA